MRKDLLQRRMIIQNDHYLEDVDSSANNLFRRSSGPRAYAASIGFNESGEWSWLPQILMYSYYLLKIITTFLVYSEMNHFLYARENEHFP